VNKRRIGDVSCKQLFEQIEKEAKGSHLDVVISSEALELEWVDVGAFIRALLPHLDSEPMDVEIIVACREHFSRAASWYNHRMRARKVGENHIVPDDFLISHAPEICYVPLIHRLEIGGFKVTPLSYHPTEDWTERFFRHIGFPKEKVPKIQVKNMGLSTKVLIAKVATNRAIPTVKARLRYLDAIREMPESYSSQSIAR